VGLLVSAGDVWAAALELNGWRRARQDRPLVRYQELCQELAVSGPGTFGELDSQGARSVLRRYSDAWFAAARRRHGGDQRARFPRRRRALVPLRWYHGTFTLAVRRLRIPVARDCPALWMRLDRDLPYPPEQVRSVTLLYDAGRLWVDVTAEVPVACYPAGHEPDPSRVAGLDLGIIHPYAVAGPGGDGLLVSGRAVRAEHRMHLADTKARARAVARRAPKPGAERLAAVAALPAPPARGGGAAPAAGPPDSARGCQSGHHLGRRPAGRHPGGRRPPRRAQSQSRASAQPAHPGLAHRPPDHSAE
jgi:putative transposase